MIGDRVVAAEDRPAAGRPVRAPWMLVAAAVLISVVVGLVLVFGVRRPPPLPSLEQDPEPAPSGAVAWSGYDDRHDEWCVWIARPDAALERAFCARDGGSLVGWTDDGMLVENWVDAGGQVVEVVDPRTGEVLDRVEDADVPRPHEQAAVRSRRVDDELVVTRVDDRHEVWRVRAHDRYEITTSRGSPDGGWIAMTDSAGRLLVTPTDADAQPRVWAMDVPAWTTLVWEGSDAQR